MPLFFVVKRKILKQKTGLNEQVIGAGESNWQNLGIVKPQKRL
jgi:hypothetical protein